MIKNVITLALLVVLVAPAAAQEERQKAQKSTAKPAQLKTTPDDLPKKIHKFNGMLVGKLAKKDIEKGTFIVQVDAVSRVWRNSKAADPKCIVGKSIEIDGVSGKWLDVLLVVKTGETLEFEAKHDGGNRLRFPGELLRKVAPFKRENYPELPEAFRGFKGAVDAKIIKKDPDTFELIVKVDHVTKTWDGSKAKKPKSIEGKNLMLAGFWQRKETYHALKVGDLIEVGMQHIGMRSDHLNVAEFIRKSGEGSKPDQPGDDVASKGVQGFRGVLVGRLLKKDVERGTFVINVDRVPRVWNNNRATNPKSLLGKDVELEGVTGKRLDVLVVARVGETLEVGSLHERGARLRVAELLRKVAPIKPGDYPELPEGFRGFHGVLVGEVVKKDPQILELIVKVSAVKSSGEKSRAKDAQSIVGKRIMLSGFWRRKDDFHGLSAGTSIQFGVAHPQSRSDHMQVTDSIRKLTAKDRD